MELVVAEVVAVLGKYVKDRGKALADEYGPKAREAAEKLFDVVMGALKSDPAEAKNAERYEKNPDAFGPSLEAALEEKIKDPQFAAELRKLMGQFDAASPGSAQLLVTGSGAAASHGGVAAGAAGAAASGGSATVYNSPPPKAPSDRQ